MAAQILSSLISDVQISEDKKTITVTRLDGSQSSFTFSEQLDMDTIEINNGIYFQDNVSLENDGIYIDSSKSVSVVKNGKIYERGIYDTDSRMSLEESSLISVVDGREVYSETETFATQILGGQILRIGEYIGNAVQLFTSPTSVSLQTEMDTINMYQDENFAIVDSMFVGTRYYGEMKSSFFIDNNTVIGHSKLGDICHVNTNTDTATPIIKDVAAYSVYGSSFAWLSGSTVTIERLVGGEKLFNEYPEAIITLANTPDKIALCGDMFIVGIENDVIYLYGLDGQIISSSNIFSHIDAIAVDRRFNFIYAQNGRVNMLKLYDSFVPVTSFLIQNNARCPLKYQIGVTYKKTPSVASVVNIGDNIIDAAFTSSFDLIVLQGDRIKKYSYVDNNPHGAVSSVTVSADILNSPLSIIYVGSFIYVTTLNSGNILMAYNADTLVRENTQDINLSDVVNGDNILSIAINTNGTVSILDSDYRVVIINSVISKVILGAFNAVTYTSYESKICSTDGKNILSSHVTSKGTNIHTIFAESGSIDDIYAISLGKHSIPFIYGMRLFTLGEDGTTLSEYLQEIEVKVI